MRRIFIIVILLLFPSLTLAECTNSDMTRLKKLASNISYVVEEDDTGLFVTFTGVSDELSLYLDYRKNTNSNGFGEISFYGLSDGSSYEFNVYGNNKCTYETIKIINVSTALKNMYYDNPICEKAKGYKYCQKWIDKSISYQKLKEGVEQYLNDNQKKGNNESQNQNSEHDFYYYYNKYYWLALGTSIGLLGILVYLWVKQNKKNQL